MKNVLRPYSFLLYLLTLLVFFFVGIFYANFVDAGKDQMLAGAAIVLGYGAVTAFIALVLSIIFAIYSSRKRIVLLNKVLLVALFVFVGYFIWNYYSTVRSQEVKPSEVQPTTPTSVTKELSTVGRSIESKPNPKLDSANTLLS